MALLRWMAVLVSAVLLADFYRNGALLGKSLAIHVSWFAAAAWLQFFASSAALSATGLLLQTVLAVYLILRWKFAVI
jgi:hypothetical protein